MRSCSCSARLELLRRRARHGSRRRATSGLVRLPSFSGLLAAQELSDALATCELLLFVDPLGPNSRKTTLAASLASGTPVLALDGQRRWGELADACAAELVPRSVDALADALGALLVDDAGPRAARRAGAAVRRAADERAARRAHDRDAATRRRRALALWETAARCRGECIRRVSARRVRRGRRSST